MIKRILFLAAISSLLFVCMSPAQTLADVARKQRQDKKQPNAKVYTNDDLQSSPPANSPAPAAAAASVPAGTSAATSDKTKKDDKTAADEDEAKRKSFKSRADAAKAEIAQIQHDLEIAEREYKLRAAVYYADAGNSLRDPKAWADQDRKYQAERANKQKDLDAAKQKLADIQDEARKAGVANAVD